MVYWLGKPFRHQAKFGEETGCCFRRVAPSDAKPTKWEDGWFECWVDARCWEKKIWADGGIGEVRSCRRVSIESGWLGWSRMIFAPRWIAWLVVCPWHQDPKGDLHKISYWKLSTKSCRAQMKISRNMKLSCLWVQLGLLMDCLLYAVYNNNKYIYILFIYI